MSICFHHHHSSDVIYWFRRLTCGSTVQSSQWVTGPWHSWVTGIMGQRVLTNDLLVFGRCALSPVVNSTFTWKSHISPLLKKSSHDKKELSNYCPVSKATERAVKSRLTDPLSRNNPLNGNQSAYCKHHSTEHWKCFPVHSRPPHQCCWFSAGLLPMSSWSTCCLWHCIDHDILPTRLSSWFHIRGLALSSFRNYLLSRSSSLKVLVFCFHPSLYCCRLIMHRPISTSAANSSCSGRHWTDCLST